MCVWSGNLRRNYNLLDFDRKKNFEQTVTYELPAGRGHRFFTPASLPTLWAGGRLRQPSDALGLPFTISTTSATGGTTQTVNMTGSYQVTHSVTRAANTAWFNTASFAAPAACVACRPATLFHAQSEYATERVPWPRIFLR